MVVNSSKLCPFQNSIELVFFNSIELIFKGVFYSLKTRPQTALPFMCSQFQEGKQNKNKKNFL